MKFTTRKIVFAGLMIAFAAVLAQFPINGSIGLDALPAFFAAVAISPLIGGIVGFIAHMIIATAAGFYLSLPVHIVVAIMMFVSCYGYGVVRVKVNRYVGIVVGILLNGPVTLAIAAVIAKLFGGELSGMPMFLLLIVPLTLTATVNIILADVVYGLTYKHVEKFKA